LGAWRSEGLHRNLRWSERGKLIGAATYWAQGGKQVEDKTQDDAKAFGLNLSAPPKTDDGDAYIVWDENWDTLLMFLRMQTQWNTTMAGYLGLKYEVLLMQGGLFDLYCVQDRPTMLEDLRKMEAAALSELNKAGDK
jgi:hypothetical protein